MQRLTGKFVAVGNGGRKVTVHVYKDFIPVENFEGSGVVEGITYIRTAEGQPLNRLDKGVYQGRLTGETLRSDDPAAP